ncbi:MAG: aminotransferase class V-fold PLP-dependent enzyme [Planctomycetota bacterium]|nr:aminotransferase class V-fold PLP-dependent enzyme [Planctomycetota bacterium]
MQMFSSNLLHEIREQFDYIDSDPVDGERIFLDSASGSLRLKAVTDALAEHSRWPDQVGRLGAGSRRVADAIQQGTEDVRLLLGASAGVIMPAMSSTHAAFRAVNAVLSSHPGGSVVTTSIEHPGVYDATCQLAQKHGQEWRVAPVNPQTGFISVESILDRVEPETRLIAVMHGANLTGAVHDITSIAREARTINNDIFVLSDGVQYAPHAPVDVVKLGVDAYLFSPYKTFCTKGIGFGWLSDRMASLPHWSLAGKPADDWSLGCPENATFAAWSVAVDYLAWLGSHFITSPDRREHIVAAMRASQLHLEGLLHRLVDGLRKMDHVELIGVDDDLANRVCLLLFNVNGLPAAQASEYLHRQGIRVPHRVFESCEKYALESLGVRDALRISACHYNTPQEIDTFLRVVSQLAPPFRAANL